MSLHVFGNILTAYGVASNNHGESNGGNIVPLQKMIWHGATHTTVSASALRFALRRILLERGHPMHRRWSDDEKRNFWSSVSDPTADMQTQKNKVGNELAKWADPNYLGFTDDDLLGFMYAFNTKKGQKEIAEAKSDAPDLMRAGTTLQEPVRKPKTVSERKKKKKEEEPDERPDDEKEAAPKDTEADEGNCLSRLGVLEMTPAVSVTPWDADAVFGVAGSWANVGSPKPDHASPFKVETHSTRYQYGISMTPERLRDPSRSAAAIQGLCDIGSVAGSHSRYKFDFSPELVVFRLTNDPAARILFTFETDLTGGQINAPSLLHRIECGDILASELVVGSSQREMPLLTALQAHGVNVLGVRAASHLVCSRLAEQLKFDLPQADVPIHL